MILRRALRTGATLAWLALPAVANAHGGNPAEAVILTPDELGRPVDDSFLVTWQDAGAPPPPTGSATVSIFYAETLPPTFSLGSIPETLTGTVIFTDEEENMPDEVLWDVSDLPSAHYWIWSRVDEPPEEFSPQYIRFSLVPLTVRHPGDSVGPTIAITRPRTEFSSADDFYNIEYQSWSEVEARIRFEAALAVFGEEPHWIPILENLPAQPRGAIGWNTADLPDGDWMVRATIEDCEGRSTTSYARYFVFVIHEDPVPEITDAGAGDAGSIEEWCTAPDSGVVFDAGFAPDAGSAPDSGRAQIDAGKTSPEPGGGCGCSAVGPLRMRFPWMMFLMVPVPPLVRRVKRVLAGRTALH